MTFFGPLIATWHFSEFKLLYITKIVKPTKIQEQSMITEKVNCAYGQIFCCLKFQFQNLLVFQTTANP